MGNFNLHITEAAVNSVNSKWKFEKRRVPVTLRLRPLSDFRLLQLKLIFLAFMFANYVGLVYDNDEAILCKIDRIASSIKRSWLIVDRR